ncbi:MAG: MBL fold metallo-hydrolase [bacterium]
MSSARYFLRTDTAMEPMVNQWYAHPFLLAPATAARTLATSQISIMDSYVRSPKMHADALKNRLMAGGPFINYGGRRVDEIERLRDRIQREKTFVIEFSDAIGELDDVLLEVGDGSSLEPLYDEVPEPLKGYVELVYDRNNQPGFRFLESLLYRSPYYDRSAQGLALFRHVQDRRPFIMSTPRLPDNERLHLSVPFSSERIDNLYDLRSTPQPLEEIRDRLELGPEELEAFRAFLTEEEPAPREPYDGDGVRVRYFSHACVLIETRDVSILTDPLASVAYPEGPDRFTLADLPESIDYVLITHSHLDHILLETLLPLRRRIRNILVPRNGPGTLEDPSIRLMLENAGFGNVRDVEDMERIEVPGGAITTVPFFGEHGDLAVRTKSAYSVKLHGKHLLLVADSSILESRVYRLVHEEIGDADALFINMESVGAPVTWAYGAVMTQPVDRKMADTRRTKGSNVEQGIGMVDQFRPQEAYIYAMGHEPWMYHVLAVEYEEEDKQMRDTGAFLRECRQRGLESELLYCKKELFY